MPFKISPVMKIVFIAIIAIAIIYYLNKNFNSVKFDKNGNRMVTESQIQASLKKVANKYGVDYARNVERLFRKETAHFKSGQYLKTLSPGMEVSPGKKVFPFGWSSLQEFVQTNDPLSQSKFYTHTMNENGTGKSKTFIGFPDIDSSIQFVAWFIKNKRGNRFGNWYSMNSSSALAYESQLTQINARLI